MAFQTDDQRGGEDAAGFRAAKLRHIRSEAVLHLRQLHGNFHFLFQKFRPFIIFLAEFRILLLDVQLSFELFQGADQEFDFKVRVDKTAVEGSLLELREYCHTVQSSWGLSHTSFYQQYFH